MCCQLGHQQELALVHCMTSLSLGVIYGNTIVYYCFFQSKPVSCRFKISIADS